MFGLHLSSYPISTPSLVIDHLSRPMSARTGRIIEAVGQGGLIVLELLVNSADAFPPLKSAAGGTLAIVNLIIVCIVTGDSSFYQRLIHLYP